MITFFIDPHFKLIHGNFIMSYHGQCDILLLFCNESFAPGLGLEVHFRTTRVDRSIDAYSYHISGAAVLKIRSDMLEVLESGMVLLVNGNATMKENILL